MNEKRCVAYLRVSTQRQAEDPEGSLANQLHRIERFIEAKNGDGITWTLTHVYREEGVSGKDITGRPQLQKLMRDLERGVFDVLIFTELSRISRSVHDFLGLTDLFQKHGVEFISLRENFDTTSPAGRLTMTVLIALAQFEREQIGERVRAGMRARAERGLYNGGGQVFGYDLDPERKGYLFVNEQEAQVVKEVFALYLELGSIAKVVDEINQRGYRTKEHTTQQGRFKPAKPFVWGTIRNMLHNPLYIGMKGINVKNRGLDQDTLAEDERYRLVEAVWEPLIDTDTFSQVQKLIEDNYKSNRNRTSTVTHDYILSGLLWCPHCEVFLEGGSSKKQQYHYYRHPQKTKREGCGLGSVRAEAFESLVFGQLKILSEDEALMADVVTKANETSQAQLPELEHKLSLLITQRNDIEAKADALIERMTELPVEMVKELVGKKLEELVEQKNQLAQQIAEVEDEIADVRINDLNAKEIQEALKNFSAVFGALQPHEKQELLELVVEEIELTSSEMKISLLGNTQKAYFEKVGSEYLAVSDLLPRTDSNRRPGG